MRVHRFDSRAASALLVGLIVVCFMKLMFWVMSTGRPCVMSTGRLPYSAVQYQNSAGSGDQ